MAWDERLVAKDGLVGIVVVGCRVGILGGDKCVFALMVVGLDYSSSRDFPGVLECERRTSSESLSLYV